MARRQKKSLKGIFFTIAILLMCFAGLVAFRTGVFANVPKVFGEPDGIPLAEQISVRGAVKVKDLGLSDKEVRKINWTVRKLGKVFNKVNVQVDMADQFAPLEVSKKTELKMVMNLETDDGCTVQSWQENVVRADFASYMVKYLKRAAVELERFREYPEFKGKFNKVYI